MAKVATYFAMTLGAFMLWRTLDKAHVWIALRQDEKQERLEGEAKVRRAGEKLIEQARRYIHSHTCCTKLQNSFRLAQRLDYKEVLASEERDFDYKDEDLASEERDFDYKDEDLASEERDFDYKDEDLASEERLWDLYERWTSHYKISRSLTEKQQRFALFKANLEYIDKVNKMDKPYKLGLYEFADMTDLEFEQHYANTMFHDPCQETEDTKSS